MRFLNDNTGQIKYQRSFSALANLSKRTNIKPLALARMIMDEKRNEINEYVKRGGMTPETDLRKLGIQTVLIHDRRVRRKMKESNLPYEEAEKLVFRDEEVKSYTGESESFAPALLAVASSVGGASINAINKKRQEQGKAPLMSGKGWTKVKNFLSNFQLSQKEGGGLRVDIKGSESGEATSQLGAGIQAGQEQLKKEGIKAWIMDNKITVIIIAGVLIFGIYYLVKKK